jgi:hypothetical protein
MGEDGDNAYGVIRCVVLGVGRGSYREPQQKADAERNERYTFHEIRRRLASRR